MLPGDHPKLPLGGGGLADRQEIDIRALDAASDRAQPYAGRALRPRQQVVCALERIGRPGGVVAGVALGPVMEAEDLTVEAAWYAEPIAPIIGSDGTGIGPAVLEIAVAGEPGFQCLARIDQMEHAILIAHSDSAEMVIALEDRIRVLDQAQPDVRGVLGLDHLDAAAGDIA